ncbi:MAG: ribose-phosphate diphosphokinase [Halobacteriaceae archaeon]
MILPADASQGLATRLATEIGEPLAAVDYDRFPDGEQLVTGPASISGRAIVVGSTVSDGAHLQVLQLQDVARVAGADEVITVIPYLGYARQDESFDPGQPVSARAVARALSSGTDRLVTVTPHESSVLSFFDVPTTAVDAAPRLAEPLPELTDPVFLAPDADASRLASAVRDAYGRGVTDHFEKQRSSGSTVEIHPHDTAVAGRDVVVVDDIIATGTTMSEAIAHLEGPARVFVTCVHPLLVGNARLKLARAGVTAVHASDTIEGPVSTVSAAPAIADIL